MESDDFMGQFEATDVIKVMRGAPQPPQDDLLVNAMSQEATKTMNGLLQLPDAL